MKALKNRLSQLLRNNADKGAGIRAEGNTLYLYDVIGDWGVPAAGFAKALAAMTADVVHLRINSPGGDVMDGRAMATAIAQYPGKVISHIDGLAASAATYVAIAASEVEISEGAFFMIHNAWAVAIGNKASMTEMAALLDKVDGTIIADYKRKTGKDEAQIVSWMGAETWFTAQEAVDHGFVDRIVPAAKSGGDAKAWNLGAYKNAPAALTAPPANEPDFAEIAASNERRLRLLESA